MDSVQVRYKSIYGSKYCKYRSFISLLSRVSGVRISAGSPEKSLEPQWFWGFFLCLQLPLFGKNRAGWTDFFKAYRSKYRSGTKPPFPRCCGPPICSMTNPIEKERGNVMLTREYIAYQLQKYKSEQKLSIEAMAQKLGISQTSLVDYIKGRGNLRADTIDLIVSGIGITLPEAFSDPVPGCGQAGIIFQAAQELGALPTEQKQQGIQLFLAMVTLFS